jgi:hypothetical protein
MTPSDLKSNALALLKFVEENEYRIIKDERGNIVRRQEFAVIGGYIDGQLLTAQQKESLAELDQNLEASFRLSGKESLPALIDTGCRHFGFSKLPIVKFGNRIGIIWDENWVHRMKVIIKLAETKNDKSDTKSDTEKKPEKKSNPRKMNVAAADCARIYRADKGQIPMKTVVADYVEQHGGRASSILKILNDNPDQWKKTT